MIKIILQLLVTFLSNNVCIHINKCILFHNYSLYHTYLREKVWEQMMNKSILITSFISLYTRLR
uniref:Uncharacterized protein n=1 Tax=Arundo donax TaxID=35708 RepID=A0A0A9D6H7_ARUDO